MYLVKLVVQIPCYNEEKTLLSVLESIPKKIKSIDSIDIVVIDDGSTDKTIEVAKNFGVKHFVIHKKNQGLSRGFMDGLTKSLELNADIIVNTDGDNQYNQADIPKLVEPIIKNMHDIVVGDRQTSKIKHFSTFKKMMQRFGSWVVNKAAGTQIPDTVSGFRAYSRDAAFKMNVINSFSYCTETIIYAGRKGISIGSVPIRTNPPTRKSRLFKNIWQHIYRSARVILKSYFMHHPLKVFIIPGISLLVLSFAPFLRYLFLIVGEQNPGQHIQSLLLGVALFTAGMLFLVLGIIADLIKTNRVTSEAILEKLKRLEFEDKNK